MDTDYLQLKGKLRFTRQQVTDYIVFAADELTRLRALNAELVEACKMGAMDPDGKPYFSGPRLLREAAESIGDLEASGDMVDALVAKANAEEAAIAKAKETT